MNLTPAIKGFEIHVLFALTSEKTCTYTCMPIYIYFNTHRLFFAMQKVYHTPQKWAGPRWVQFYPLNGRRMQSGKLRESHFLPTSFWFLSADDKNISQSIYLPMNSTPDISTLFTDKAIQFYLLLWISKHFYEINVKVNVEQTEL